MSAPDRPGWYADPLKPTTQERRWDGSEWTDDTREASVPVSEQPAPPAPALVEATSTTSEPEPPELPDYYDLPDDEVDDEPAEPSSRVTLALVVAIVLLVAVALTEVAYLWGPLEDDPTVSSSRPVLLSTAAERSAADTAAQAAVAFTARSYTTYDEQVDAAAAMMTTGFAEEFRQTTDDAKAKFVEAEAEVTADVVAQAVMSASDEQVEVLIFLNQFTTKTDEESGFSPFRLKVTLIDTDQGWLVSDVDAN